MPSSKTVFILGAGSSASYGFPTGEQLKQLIARDNISFISDPNEAQYFRRYYSCIIQKAKAAFNDIDVTTFVEAFKSSGSFTIDTFMSSSHRTKKERQIGSFILAGIIDFFESSSRLQVKVEDDWIAYFIYRMISYNEESFILNPNFKIITFNYDSFFEQKLRLYIDNHYPVDQLSSIFKKNNLITHVYGRVNVGSYVQNPLVKEREELDFYLKDIDSLKTESIIEKAESISFIRNDVFPRKGIEISDYINEASEIYCLGYGFDRFNNKLLFGDSSNFKSIAPKLKFTTYGFPHTLQNHLNSLTIRNYSQSTFTPKNEKCLDFLSRVIPPELFPTE